MQRILLLHCTFEETKCCKKYFFDQKKIFFFQFFFKNRVIQNFYADFGLEKTALDRIPQYTQHNCGLITRGVSEIILQTYSNKNFVKL